MGWSQRLEERLLCVVCSRRGISRYSAGALPTQLSVRCYDPRYISICIVDCWPSGLVSTETTRRRTFRVDRAIWGL